MNLLGAVIGGFVAYAAFLLFLAEILRVDPKSNWYWMPFAVSVAAVIFLGLRRRTSWGYTLVGIALSSALVLALDLAAGVWYSCSKGDCL